MAKKVTKQEEEDLDLVSRRLQRLAYVWKGSPYSTEDVNDLIIQLLGESELATLKKGGPTFQKLWYSQINRWRTSTHSKMNTITKKLASDIMKTPFGVEYKGTLQAYLQSYNNSSGNNAYNPPLITSMDDHEFSTDLQDPERLKVFIRELTLGGALSFNKLLNEDGTLNAGWGYIFSLLILQMVQFHCVGRDYGDDSILEGMHHTLRGEIRTRVANGLIPNEDVSEINSTGPGHPVIYVPAQTALPF